MLYRNKFLETNPESVAIDFSPVFLSRWINANEIDERIDEEFCKNTVEHRFFIWRDHFKYQIHNHIASLFSVRTPSPKFNY